MNFIDKLRGSLRSKTAWFAYMLMAAGVIDQLTPFIASMVPQKYSGLVVAVLGLLVWILRAATSKPLDAK